MSEEILQADGATGTRRHMASPRRIDMGSSYILQVLLVLHQLPWFVDLGISEGLLIDIALVLGATATGIRGWVEWKKEGGDANR